MILIMMMTGKNKWDWNDDEEEEEEEEESGKKRRKRQWMPDPKILLMPIICQEIHE